MQGYGFLKTIEFPVLSNGYLVRSGAFYLPPMFNSTSDRDDAWEAAWGHEFFNDPRGYIHGMKGDTLNPAFGNKGGALHCFDNGVRPPEGQDAVYMAGAGILYRKDLYRSLVERRTHLVAQLRDKGITSVGSHITCGACVLHCKECGGSPDITAQEWARDLARDLNIPCDGHMKKLQRPSFNDALVTYYDGTGRLNDQLLAGLPTGFIISRELFEDPTQSMFELGLSYQIANGPRGFEGRFGKDHPFNIVAVWSPAERELGEERLLAEIEIVRRQFGPTKVYSLMQPL